MRNTQRRSVSLINTTRTSRIEDVQEQLGDKVATLVSGVERMNAIDNIHHFNPASINHQQLDNFRKMLIAMVDDVRVTQTKHKKSRL